MESLPHLQSAGGTVPAAAGADGRQVIEEQGKLDIDMMLAFRSRRRDGQGDWGNDANSWIDTDTHLSDLRSTERRFPIARRRRTELQLTFESF